ncbi:Dynamin-like protein ARC5 [Chlorella vulgaris]
MASWLQQQATQAAQPGRYAMRASQDLDPEDSSRTPPSVRRGSAALRASVLEIPSDMSPGRSERAFRTGNERLYEAYNDLHALAQDFEKPFDAPAILVVGHQTDGKSALVEALMGFQFNHVGGGTKTRRPITLHMKYNSACVQPHCYLITDEFGEQEATLEELQDYIENENSRLDRESQFWSKEIVVRIEYKFCPNLTIIDTPGLISAAPGKRNTTLQNSARQVEAMVRQKMEQKEYIILCLEDSNDWSNATTRRLVMQVDPSLTRTVVVSTKLDTRIPQFARPHDVEMYLRPPARLLEPTMLGGSPFFTSVPSGRVGNSKDAIFRSNEHFREAVADREALDVAELESRLGRKLERAERARIGVGQLRRFAEHLLQRRYLENVPTIVPVLEKEYRNASRRLEETQVELNDLHPEKLKEKGRVFRESFLSKLALLLRGTVAAPPERFGETLADEHIRGGAFVGPDNKPVMVNEQLPNAHMRLFGGAQYHRAMAEFRAGIGTINCPDISREEIVNACGIDDFHDGVNYTRTACVIAVSKARDLFEPFLHQLGYRLAHVQRRMLPIAMHLLQKDGQFLNGHDLFLKRVGAAYHAFIDEFEKGSRNKCMEDLQSTTRYVTWSLHTKSRSSLKAMLSKVTSPGGNQPGGNNNNGGGGGKGHHGHHGASSAAAEGSSGATADFLENTLWNRTLGSMSEEIVAALVCQIFEGIRDHFVQSVELKFNCFFLMPIIDTFPTKLREELESAYDEDLDEVFDVAAVRAALEQRLKSLELELHQVERLQRKFAMIHSTLAQQQSHGAKGEGDTPKLRASEENPLNMSMRSSLPGGGNLKASQELGKAASKLAAMDLSKNGAAAANRNVLSSMR